MRFSIHKINDWISQRPWPAFWRGLPALFAGLLWLGTLLLNLENHSDKTDLRQRYKRAATSALAAGQFEPARVACLRGLSLVNDQGSRLEWLFYLALALQGAGHQAEASALMATAAPLDHPGYAQAHVTVAESLLNSTNLTPEMLQMAEKHLQHALTLDPQSLEINEMLGRFYINTRQYAKARQRLLEAYPQKDELALLLAQIEKASQNAAETRAWADAAIEVFRKNLKDLSPRDSREDRLGLARALSLEDNFAGAAKTLQAGLALHEEPAYHAAIGEACAAWAAETEGPMERLWIIQTGLTNASQDLKLRLLLVQAACGTNDAAQAASKLLDQLMAGASGESAAWWHFLLWTDGRERGDLATARGHLLQAYEQAPQIPAFRNDRAMDLAAGNEADTERGLTLIESLVAQFPDCPEYRDTRGRILARLGRNEEAAADLELAAAKLATPAETRLALAKIYDAMGKTQLAGQQRRLAKNGLQP